MSGLGAGRKASHTAARRRQAARQPPLVRSKPAAPSQHTGSVHRRGRGTDAGKSGQNVVSSHSSGGRGGGSLSGGGDDPLGSVRIDKPDGLEAGGSR